MKKVMKIIGMAVTYVMAFLGGVLVLRGLQLKYPMTEDTDETDE